MSEGVMRGVIEGWGGNEGADTPAISVKKKTTRCSVYSMYLGL